jgi:molybdopterin-guanine dinucleotide biosynthesis protein A
LTTTSIVLAGGRSSRLGREKHLEKLAGESLIERVISHLSSLSTEILLVISRKQARISLQSYTHPEAKTVADLYPRKGSLGGIYTGLVYSKTLRNLVVACDMPFLNPALLRYMISLSPGFDVVIPRIGDKIEPLHAIYSKNCVKPVEEQLKRDNLRIAGFFDSVKVRYIEKEEIERFDPEHLSFFNVNTEADLEKARRLAQREAARKQKK